VSYGDILMTVASLTNLIHRHLIKDVQQDAEIKKCKIISCWNKIQKETVTGGGREIENLYYPTILKI
jgi:hypothetical protein